MCEAVEKYGERTKKIGVLDGKTEAIEGLMANAKLSLRDRKSTRLNSSHL